MNFIKIADQLIETAMENGSFENLPGQGKPLAPLIGGDPIESFGFQLMARTGAIPAEVKLKKEILRKTEQLKTICDETARHQAMKQLAQLQMRLAMMLEARK